MTPAGPALDTATNRHARLTAACPHCRAAIGAACTQPATRRSLTAGRVHPARITAATTPLRGALWEAS